MSHFAFCLYIVTSCASTERLLRVIYVSNSTMSHCRDGTGSARGWPCEQPAAGQWGTGPPEAGDERRAEHVGVCPGREGKSGVAVEFNGNGCKSHKIRGISNQVVFVIEELHKIFESKMISQISRSNFTCI